MKLYIMEDSTLVQQRIYTYFPVIKSELVNEKTQSSQEKLKIVVPIKKDNAGSSIKNLARNTKTQLKTSGKGFTDKKISKTKRDVRHESQQTSDNLLSKPLKVSVKKRSKKEDRYEDDIIDDSQYDTQRKRCVRNERKSVSNTSPNNSRYLPESHDKEKDIMIIIDDSDEDVQVQDAQGNESTKIDNSDLIANDNNGQINNNEDHLDSAEDIVLSFFSSSKQSNSETLPTPTSKSNKNFNFGIKSKSLYQQEQVVDKEKRPFANGHDTRKDISPFATKRFINDPNRIVELENIPLSPAKKTKVDIQQIKQDETPTKVKKKFSFGSSRKKITQICEESTNNSEDVIQHYKRVLFPCGQNNPNIEETEEMDGDLNILNRKLSTLNRRTKITSSVLPVQDVGTTFSSISNDNSLDVNVLSSNNKENNETILLESPKSKSKTSIIITNDSIDYNLSDYGIHAKEFEDYSPSFYDISMDRVNCRNSTRDSTTDTTTGNENFTLRVKSLSELQSLQTETQCDKKINQDLVKVAQGNQDDYKTKEIYEENRALVEELEKLKKKIQNIEGQIELNNSLALLNDKIRKGVKFEIETNPGINSTTDQDPDATIICDSSICESSSNSNLQVSSLTICKEEEFFSVTMPLPIASTSYSKITSHSSSISIVSSTYAEEDSKANEDLLKIDLVLENQDSFIRSVFQQIWEYVKSSPYLCGLLSTEEWNALSRLFIMPDDFQEVCMRLFTRQTKWYQVDKFVEKIKLRMNTTDVYEMLDHLEQLQFIFQDYQSMETLDSLLNLLLVSDLKDIAKIFLIKSSGKKKVLIKKLLKLGSEQKTMPTSTMTMEEVIMQNVAVKLGRCVKLNDTLRVSLYRLQLLYYFPIANITTTQELYLYISDMRSRKFTLPSFTVTEIEIFANCDHFGSYADASTLYNDYVSLKESKVKNKKDGLQEMAEEAYKSLKALHANDQPNSGKKKNNVAIRFTAGYLYSKLLTLACTDLTKNNDLVKKWLNYLLKHNDCATKRGDWYVQLSMHLERYDKNIHAAVEIINKGLLDPEVNLTDKYKLSSRGSSLIKSKKLNDNPLSNNLITVPSIKVIPTSIVTAKPVPLETRKMVGSRIRILYKEDSVLYTVEEIAKVHYEKQGYPKGIHCEGALMMTLFTVLFWDIIYSNVEGAFVSEMQYIPLDLYTKEFYLTRKQQIDRRLKEIANEWDDDEFFDFIRKWEVDHLHEKSLHSPQFIDGSMVMIESAICITRPKLAKILERLVKDLRQYQAGMPDLFLWNPKTKQCLFSEVKSQNDILSMKQKDWLCFLQEIEVPAEVCLVNSAGSKPNTSAK